MSFIKISDPKRRDEIIQEYLRTKRSIQQQSFDKILEDKNIYTQQEKLFKPIIDAQKDQSENLQKELQKVTSSIDQLTVLPPGAEGGPLPIEGEPPKSNDDKEETMNVGPLASEALSRQKFNDLTTGLVRQKFGEYQIGQETVTLDGDDLNIGGKRYKGTPGLWNLITMKNPERGGFTDADKEVYADIMIRTNALRDTSRPGRHPIAGTRSLKWKNIQKSIWEKQKAIEDGKQFTGKGVEFLPSDPKQLLEQLKLSLASNQAGNTGERNRIVSILDTLLGMGILNREEYKNINLAVK